MGSEWRIVSNEKYDSLMVVLKLTTGVEAGRLFRTITRHD